MDIGSVMDEGKHAMWGEGFPDMEKFSDRDYQYPHSEYRPCWRACVPRRSDYPELQLNNARLTLLRALAMPPVEKPKKYLGTSIYLGIPFPMPEVVVKHVETKQPYNELEVREESSRYGDNTSTVSESVKNLDYTENCEENDYWTPGGSGSKTGVTDPIQGQGQGQGQSQGQNQVEDLHTQSLVNDLTAGLLPPELTPAFDLPRYNGPKISILMTHLKGATQKQIAKSLGYLNLVQVVKCDYCIYTFAVDKADTRKLDMISIRETVMKHLQSAVHFSASFYFGKMETDGTITLTELSRPCFVRFNEAYLSTVLAVCPTCGFVFETIHHCAAHSRYVHQEKNGVYGLINVAKTDVVSDPLSPVCSVCEERFDTTRDLRHHEKMENHTAYRHELFGRRMKQLVPCPLCDSIYLNFQSVRSHIAIDHADISPDQVPPLIISSFLGREQDGWPSDSIQISSIPVPTETHYVVKLSVEDIETRDQQLLKRNVDFFNRVHGYPAQCKEKTILADIKKHHAQTPSNKPLGFYSSEPLESNSALCEQSEGKEDSKRKRKAKTRAKMRERKKKRKVEAEIVGQNQPDSLADDGKGNTQKKKKFKQKRTHRRARKRMRMEKEMQGEQNLPLNQ